MPCEIMLWNFLPAFRSELVKAMLKNNLKRKEVTELFNIKESTISQYIKSKRGTRFKFSKEMQDRIEEIAKKIIKSKNKEDVISETCKLCSELKEQKCFCLMHQKENPFLISCSNKAACAACNSKQQK